MDADVVIVGGGSAGQQAALTLGRLRRSVVLVDAGRPSNAPAHAIGGLLGAHDLAPLALLHTGREQLAELPTVRLLDGVAVHVAGGAVTLEDRTQITTRAIVLATGGDYAVPDVPGLEALWGTSVIHCPFCHGWEARDQRIALLSAGPEHESHLVGLLRCISDDVLVFEALAGVRADGEALRAVVLPDGSEVERDVLFVAAPPVLRDAAFAHLPLERDAGGLLAVDTFGHTSVEGVFAAGDLVTPAPSVAQAIASGQRAAVGVVRDLLAPA